MLILIHLGPCYVNMGKFLKNSIIQICLTLLTLTTYTHWTWSFVLTLSPNYSISKAGCISSYMLYGKVSKKLYNLDLLNSADANNLYALDMGFCPYPESQLFYFQGWLHIELQFNMGKFPKKLHNPDLLNSTDANNLYALAMGFCPCP